MPTETRVTVTVDTRPIPLSLLAFGTFLSTFTIVLGLLLLWRP
jgi:hypothetical protein